MAHSHLSFQHFLKQLQKKRTSNTQNNIQPEWVSGFVDRVADLFVPIHQDGRVGFECMLTERGWKIIMFLGLTEMIGGRNDGSAQPADFEFHLSDLTRIFDTVELLKWETYPSTSDTNPRQNHSLIISEGTFENNFVQLELHSVPPSDIGPGFREFPNGKRSLV